MASVLQSSQPNSDWLWKQGIQNPVASQSTGLMSQPISRWNPKEVGSNPSEGMDVLARRGQAGKERMFPFPMSLHTLAGEGVAHIEGVSSHLKVWMSSYLKGPD